MSNTSFPPLKRTKKKNDDEILILSDEQKTNDSWCHTQVKIKTLTFAWSISKFSYLTTRMGEYIESSKFWIEEHSDVKWYMTCYPHGKSEESKHFVSLFIQFTSYTRSHIPIDLRFFIVDKDNKKYSEFRVKKYNMMKDLPIGKIAFIRQDEMTENTVLPNDTLKIFCDIFIGTDIEITESANNSINLNETKIKLNVLNDFKVLLENGNYSDMCFKVNGKKYSAHKAIVTARSNVFATMFQHNMLEQSTGIIEIDDIQEEVFEEVLQFIYTGIVSRVQERTSKLLIAADKYGLEELKKMCELVIIKRLNCDNVIDSLVFADKYNATDLEKHAIQFLRAHTDIYDQPKFICFGHAYPHLIIKILIGNV